VSAAETKKLVATFFRRHGIYAITLTPMSGITAAHSVCDLGIEFAADKNHTDYRAQFKLQGDEASIGDLVTHIDATGRLKLAESQSESSSLHAVLESFLKAIETRVAKVRHEQSVQSVTFLGNRFMLNGKIEFTVVEDVEGRLKIELHKGEDRQPAVLLASSLLDGLYDGSIQLLNSEHT